MAPGLRPAFPHGLGFSWLRSCLEACGPSTFEGPVVPWELLKRVGGRAPSLPWLPAAPSLGPKQPGPSQEATSQLAFLTPRTCLLAQASQGQGPHRTGFSSHPTWGPCPGLWGGEGAGPPSSRDVGVGLGLACGLWGTGCSEPVPVTLAPWGPVWPGEGGRGRGLEGVDWGEWGGGRDMGPWAQCGPVLTPGCSHRPLVPSPSGPCQPPPCDPQGLGGPVVLPPAIRGHGVVLRAPRPQHCPGQHPGAAEGRLQACALLAGNP